MFVCRVERPGMVEEILQMAALLLMFLLGLFVVVHTLVSFTHSD